MAMDCVLNPARLAKEKGYGHNIDERQLGLYSDTIAFWQGIARHTSRQM